MRPEVYVVSIRDAERTFEVKPSVEVIDRWVREYYGLLCESGNYPAIVVGVYDDHYSSVSPHVWGFRGFGYDRTWSSV